MSFKLTLEFYNVIAQLPVCESRNITDQIRRAATSLPCNIAEGASSASTKLFVNHLKYAYASGKELEVLLMLCVKLKYISEVEFEKIFDLLDKFKCALFKMIMNTERKSARNKMNFLEITN